MFLHHFTRLPPVTVVALAPTNQNINLVHACVVDCNVSSLCIRKAGVSQ